MTASTNQLHVKVGQIVEIRPAAEILATLDERGECHGVPFMPEMHQHVGKQYRVAQLALKVCGPAGNVHMSPGSVYLDQIRCDGSAHGGCQADCRFFWREEWLRRVEPRSLPRSDHATDQLLAQVASTNVKANQAEGGPPPAWRCQATQILCAGKQVSWKKPGQYFREVTAGNVAPLHFVRVMSRATLRYAGRKLRAIDELEAKPAGANRVDGEQVGLQPGDWVEVRSVAEIGETLDANYRHRGLSFTYEMAQHCGKRFRVRRYVNQIIDETTGQMLKFSKYRCVDLEGVVCTGDRATSVWFCRRELPVFWREAWLKRVAPPASSEQNMSM